MNQGDVVYFKLAQDSSHRKSKKITFKGMGYGVFLGHVPPFQKDPPPAHLIRQMGQIGFVTFDDVAQILGDEQAALVVKKFEEKYYGEEAQAEAPVTSQTVLPGEAENKSLLVGPTGLKLARNEDEPSI